MTTNHLAHYRVGAELARYVRSQTGRGVPPVTVLQAVVADIAATMPNLAIPLRDLVSRQGFQVLLPLAGSGSGELQRKSLVDDIRQLYQPDVVEALVEVLNGFLELRSEVATRSGKSVDTSTVITHKEAVETNTGEYSIKDIGSYDPRYMQPDMDRAMEELGRNFMGRQKYLEREIGQLSMKSNHRKVTARRYSRSRGHVLSAICGGSLITLIFAYAALSAGHGPVGIIVTVIAGTLFTLGMFL